jgi:osmotically inducible protein OsmC
MADIKRKGGAVWKGNLRKGQGRIHTASKVLLDTPYSFSTRFENEPGTNPEELIAAAHAACFTMAFANGLSHNGHEPESIETEATITLTAEAGRHTITRMNLHTRGRVPDIDVQAFRQIAEEAGENCPVSRLLRPGLKIELEAELL